VIYLTYAEIPERKIEVFEAERLFGKILYIDSVAKRKSDISKKESLAALLLLAETLRSSGTDPSGVTLEKDENGRPHIKENREIDFSLSHSGGIVACAVSTDGRVGVDIEKITDKYERVAKRFFSEAEQGIAKNAEDFVRVWTRKEAYYKFFGKGSLSELDSEADDGVNIESFLLDGEYFISVCTIKTVEICQNPQKTEIK